MSGFNNPFNGVSISVLRGVEWLPAKVRVFLAAQAPGGIGEQRFRSETHSKENAGLIHSLLDPEAAIMPGGYKTNNQDYMEFLQYPCSLSGLCLSAWTPMSRASTNEPAAGAGKGGEK